mmetsp:Transcript_1730/g.4884  ORF Transcript_1730/g.4884 Transcript_1730/m.4884 type:complete len:110 (-) Transcript_1730:120-449(-)
MPCSVATARPAAFRHLLRTAIDRCTASPLHRRTHGVKLRRLQLLLRLHTLRDALPSLSGAFPIQQSLLNVSPRFVTGWFSCFYPGIFSIEVFDCGLMKMLIYCTLVLSG